MNRSGRGVLGALALVVLAALALLLWRRDAPRAPAREVPVPAIDARLAAAPPADAPPRILAAIGQRGAPPRRVAGRVLYREKPVAGAQVSLSFSLVEAGSIPRPRAVTDAAGHFDLGRWPAVVAIVGATHPDHAAGFVDVDLRDPTARTDDLVVNLEDCATVADGVVREAGGAAIAGARFATRGTTLGVAGADGRYRLCLAPGVDGAHVTADGYGGLVVSFEGHRRVTRDIVLVPEGVLVVRVVLEVGGGVPVPDAVVSAWPADWGPERSDEAWGTTGPDGRTELRGLAPGRYHVWAATRDAKGTVQAVVEATKVVEVELRAARHARLSGVALEDGRPVAGATIVARSQRISRASANAVTQADGRFALDEVPLGEVTFGATPYEVRRPERFVVDGAREDLVLELARMAAIRGRVLRGGAPVAGAEVRAGELATTSRPDGSYALEALAPGPYDLAARSAKDGARSRRRALRLAAGEQQDGVDLELGDAGVIAGEVVDEAGAPVPGAAVTWAGPDDSAVAVAGANGAFACDGLRGGRYLATVTLHGQPLPPAGAPHAAVLLTGGDDRMDGVRLAVRGAREEIAGRVVDGKGAPVADARVAAHVQHGDAAPDRLWWRGDVPQAVSGADGAFLLERLPEGRYTLVASGAGGASGVTSGVASGARDARVVLVLPARIEGTLVGFAGAPPSVDARRLEVDDRPTRADVAGASFRIGPLPPGAYVVGAQSRAGADAVVVRLEPGEEAKVTLTARGRGALEGVVRELPGGAPVAGLRCTMVATSGGEPGTTFWGSSLTVDGDDAGRFVFDPAPAGPTHVHCYARGDFSLSGSRGAALVPAGGRATIELGAVRRRGDRRFETGMTLDPWHVPPLVDVVVPESPAAAAGLRPGDVILGVDGVPMSNVYMNGVYYLLWSRAPGDVVPIVVERAASKLTMGLKVE